MDVAPDLKLHHVSLMVTDAERSAVFYTDLLGLTLLERPAFKSKGAWLATSATGHLQVHLVEYEPGAPPPPRRDPIPQDAHFGLNAADFDGFVSRLQSRGYSEDAPPGDPRRMLIRRDGPAGFPQVYLLDPDCNIIEVNGAP